MSIHLAVDAGGTHTRAVTIDVAGHALGHGSAGVGNPTAAGVADAVAAIGEAARLASEACSGVSEGFGLATIAMAGEKSGRFAEELTTRLASLGWRQVSLEHDLLGVFHSGTHLVDGYALIAGTGSVAARVVDGRLDQVVGGRGWLLGDAGSGFWIGQRVARAAVGALDGQQPETALTGLVLKASGLSAELASPAERKRVARQLVSTLYAQKPVSLAALAPLAFTAHEDPTARAILVAASKALADLVDAVIVPEVPGPVVGGGSVLVRGLFPAPPDLRRELVPIGGAAGLIPVPDGVVGAAVLGLRSVGIEVDQALFDRLRTEIERVRGVS